MGKKGILPILRKEREGWAPDSKYRYYGTLETIRSIAAHGAGSSAIPDPCCRRSVGPREIQSGKSACRRTILRSNRTTAQFARKRRLGVGPMCRVRLLQLKEVIGRVPQLRLFGPGMAPNLTRQRHEACMALLPHGENEKSPGLKARSGLFCLRVTWSAAPPLFISAACGQSSRPNRPAPGRPLPRRWGYR